MLHDVYMGFICAILEGLSLFLYVSGFCISIELGWEFSFAASIKSRLGHIG
jgi:hypothetical protein